MPTSWGYLFLTDLIIKSLRTYIKILISSILTLATNTT